MRAIMRLQASFYLWLAEVLERLLAAAVPEMKLRGMESFPGRGATLFRIGIG
jgi:hypothetical protein